MKTIVSAQKYFDKNGFIYGNSYKFSFGRWENRITKFNNLNEALEWLNTEEYDFRQREFISKTEAMKLL